MSRFFLFGLFIFLFRFLIYYMIDKYEIESRLVKRFPKYNANRIGTQIERIANILSWILSIMLVILLSYLLEKKLGISSDFLYW